MILLSCAKLPENPDKAELARVVRLTLSNEANFGYISALEQKENECAARESLYALALLCRSLSLFPIHTNAAELTLARNENGKPYFLNSSLKFNLSHSEGIVACAISDEGEVGVDVEASQLAPDRAKKIAQRFLSHTDAKAIEADPSRFVRLWSEKEAEAKFFGTNLPEFLQNERKEAENAQNVQSSSEIAIHRFSYDKIPITLCTTRDFSTVKFICAT